ncbi:MAG: thioredoxin domain-containing protein [Thermodesulfovibrionales bacterium]
MKKVFLILSLCAFFISTASASELKLLLFFSATCPHCKEVMPYVKELNEEFPVEGILYGKKEAPELPFPVKSGTKELKERYALKGVPSLVVLEDKKFRTRFSGAKDIKDSYVIIKGLKMGAITVSEAMERLPVDDFILTGWITHKGGYFDKDSKFFITDRQKEILLKPWLPIEAVKGLFKNKGPRVMSDIIGMPVVLRGKIIETDEGYQFIVKEELRISGEKR